MVRDLLRLAAPLVVTQLGMVLYGTVDILFVSPLGAEAIGAVGLAGVTYFTIFIFGMGILMGVDPLSARAHGEGDDDRWSSLLVHNLALAAALAVPLWACFSLAGPVYRLIAVEERTRELALSYVGLARWCVFPGLAFVACRQSLQTMNSTRPLLAAIVLGNAANALLDWKLIPVLGVRGSAAATLAANLVMFGVVAASVPRWRFDRWRPDVWRSILRLGLPGGAQFLAEVAVFSLVTALVGRLGPVSLAANQLVLNLASITFMVPMGLAHAAAARVGQGLGRGRPAFSVAAGNAAMLLAGGFMSATAAVFALLPRATLGLYTEDAAILDLGVKLLYAAAVFQVFDGLQAVLTGALRGAGHTKQALYANLAGHWAFGLPLGCWLAFGRGWGAVGLWIGLCVGLVFVAARLGYEWRATSRALTASSSRSACGPRDTRRRG